MDEDYNFEVGDHVDGVHRQTRRHLRGKVIKVLPDYEYLVESDESRPGFVPKGEQVIVSGNDLND